MNRILWFAKPYTIGGTIIDNMPEHGVGAFNEAAFVRYADFPNDFISVQSSKNDTGLHQTQRPVNLIDALIELTTSKNQLVVDPFCRSSATLVSTCNLGKNLIGIELQGNYYKNAYKRMSKLLAKDF